MPLYEIQHVTTLTPSEQDSLAEAITQIHSTKFTTPKMFVNVKFTPSSDITTYVGGKRKSGNHILATVRVGASRSQKDFEDLCTEIVKAWERIVPATSSSKGEDRELRSCILMGGLIGGYEAGFMIPQAGGDVQWLKDNMAKFEEKAKAGDDAFADLVAEVKERGLLNGK